MVTLLEQAKRVTHRPSTGGGHARSISREEIDLALGWLVGDVSFTQIGTVLDQMPGMPTYLFLSRALREAHRLGRLTVEAP